MRRSKRQSNFSPFFFIHKRAKPILPPYLLPHSPRELKPFTPPLPSHTAHPSTHTSLRLIFNTTDLAAASLSESDFDLQSLKEGHVAKLYLV